MASWSDAETRVSSFREEGYIDDVKCRRVERPACLVAEEGQPIMTWWKIDGGNDCSLARNVKAGEGICIHGGATGRRHRADEVN